MYSVLPIFLEFEEIPRIIVKSEEFLRKGGAVNIFLNIFPRILPQPVGNTGMFVCLFVLNDNLVCPLLLRWH